MFRVLAMLPLLTLATAIVITFVFALAVVTFHVFCQETPLCSA